MTVGLVYAVAIFGVIIPVGAVQGLAVSVVLTAFAMVGFGLLLGGLALFSRTSIVLGNIFLFIGLLLSGVNFPLSSLPPGAAADRRRAPLDLGALGDPGRDFRRGPRTSCRPLGGGRPLGNRLPGPRHGVLGVLRATGPGHREHRPFLKSRRGAFTGGAEARPTDVVRRRRIEYPCGGAPLPGRGYIRALSLTAGPIA